ncbi:MAG: glycosyltransferase family 4 protein [Bryobacteraceae bacterium]|nr:glycosyltransferase family 4 protein [Bryobacteraceae bacterium]
MPWILLRSKLVALRAAGFDVHIACACGQHAQLLTKAGFTVHPIPFRRRLNPLAHIGALFRLTRLMQQHRFFLVNTNGPVAAAVGRVAAAISHIPVVNTVHGFYFHEGTKPFLRWLTILIERMLGRLTDAFLFVSGEDRQLALRLGIAHRADRASTIWNGVDLDRFCPGPRQQGSLAAPFTIGIVARVVREKGYREFLEMASGLVQQGLPARFLVVGDSLPSDRDQFAGQFKQEVRDAGLESRFDFRGFTEEVASCYREMDVFVLPSYREGFPVSLLEAMATGLPVVATNIRGCREAVTDGVTGLLVPPMDAPSLCRAVARILNDPELAKSLGLAARLAAETRFDDRMICRDFINRLRSFDLLPLSTS